MVALPNSVWVVLLALSVASFLPQYRQIISRRDCVGISPVYLLLNLLAATQPFTLGLHLQVVHDAPTFANRLNLAQLAATCACHAITFGLYLYYPPFVRPAKYAVIYIAFALLSLVPIIVEAAMPPASTDLFNDRRWLSAFISSGHMLTTLFATVIPCVALFFQVREQDPIALSVPGLAAQALVFVILALSWPLRTRPMHHASFLAWYVRVGWAAVDNGVFAIVQAALWWLSTRQRMQSAIADGGEETPLVT